MYGLFVTDRPPLPDQNVEGDRIHIYIHTHNALSYILFKIKCLNFPVLDACSFTEPYILLTTLIPKKLGCGVKHK